MYALKTEVHGDDHHNLCEHPEGRGQAKWQHCVLEVRVTYREPEKLPAGRMMEIWKYASRRFMVAIQAFSGMNGKADCRVVV